jgi:hypothetical protein
MSFDHTIPYSAMEVMGYSKLQASSPPESMVREVERSLRSRPNEVSETVTYGRGDHDACESFLRFGIQDHDVCLSIQWSIYRTKIMEVHQEDRRSDRKARFSSPPRPSHRPLSRFPNQLGNQGRPSGPKRSLSFPNPPREPGGQSDNLEALPGLTPLVEHRIRTGKRNADIVLFAIERGTFRARCT